MSLGFRSKMAAARLVGRLSRLSGRGGGTTLPGRLLLRWAPDAVGRMAGRLVAGSTLISASNGKTTTAAMAASALAEAGRHPIHNRAGSNMSWGVATALLDQDGDEGLFEVDEAWLPRMAAELNPRVICLGNLFRDQLDRYGELDTIADGWRKMVTEQVGSTRFVLNADDPTIAEMGLDESGERLPGVVYFGIEDVDQALTERQHTHDARRSVHSGEEYVYERVFLGHLGHYGVPATGMWRPHPDIAATRVQLLGMEGSIVDLKTPAGDTRLHLPLPGLYNVYNALAAVACGLESGLSLEQVVAGLESAEAVFGRVETLSVGDRELSILLIKNPVGANEVLRTLRLESDGTDQGSLTGSEDTDPSTDAGSSPASAGESGLDLWLALNDRIADGRDISWIWDADFEFLAGRVRRVTCAGTRAAEFALRLKYAGVDPGLITVTPDIGDSIDSALGHVPAGGKLFALPTYTALIELRTLLAKRGLAEDYWA